MNAKTVLSKLLSFLEYCRNSICAPVSWGIHSKTKGMSSSFTHLRPFVAVLPSMIATSNLF